MSFSQWKEVNLGEVVDSISIKHKFDKDKIILVNTSDVLEGKVLNHEYVENKKLKGQFKKSFQKQDILYSEIRPKNKRFAYVDFDAKDYVASTKLMVLRKKNNSIIPEFLYHLLKSEEVINNLQIIAESRSGTFPQITYSELSRLSVLLPSIEEQVTIVNTLSSLDDKIELNNKISKNLEEVAQALFKSWFIDFELYQDKEFVESELGMIPKGWEVRSLDEIADYINGLAMQKYRPESDEEYLPVIKIKELNQGFTNSDSDKSRIDIPDRNKINNGDIIFSWSGTLMVKIWAGGNGGLNQHLFKVVSDNFPKWFYYLWTKYHLQNFIAIANDRATTMGHIKRSHLSEAKVVIPNEEELKKLNDIIDPILTQSIETNIQSNKLIEIRDALLPKLMSGEIRLPIEEV